MTPLQLITIGGMTVGLGLVLLAHAIRPAPPRLSSALAQLSVAPRLTSAPLVPADRGRWLPASLAQFLDRHVGVSDADLEITQWSRPRLVARKATFGLIGLLMPAALTAALSVAVYAPPLVFPAALSLILGVGLWVAPSHEIRQNAQRARSEFGAALRALLTLVALERKARGAPAEALEEASREWQSWPFRLLHAEILRAEMAGQPPWEALRQLGDRLDVEELRNLGNIVSSAADGAAIFDTLLAESRAMQHAYLSDQHAAANAVSERLVQPVALLAIAFMTLVLTPGILRVFHS